MAHCPHHDHAAHGPEHGTLVTDPVCGMKVDTRTAQFRHELDGTTYYFCSERCLEKFKADPQRYLNPQAAAAPSTAAGGIWTCPMHPQIRRPGPGACPICGMALEPLMPAAVEDDSELRKVKTKFWFAAALSAPVVAIAMLPHLFNLHVTSSGEWLFRYTELAL